jgi:hypothetical protein
MASEWSLSADMRNPRRILARLRAAGVGDA